MRSIFNAKEIVSGGVWISPSGEIFGVPLTHIRDVVADPVKFGLTSDFIRQVFARHGEGAGSEGNARDEIISLLVLKDWIRIRFHPGDSGFHIELYRLNPKQKEFLSGWASKVLGKHPDRAGFRTEISEAVGIVSVFELRELLDSKRFIEAAYRSLESFPDNASALYKSISGVF